MVLFRNEPEDGHPAIMPDVRLLMRLFEHDALLRCAQLRLSQTI